MDQIAEVLKTCGDLPLEIQGHTDSQGREEMNLSLSQSRAESVLNELRARRVLTATFVAKGYGETEPIADNGTEEGREANRRIEFHLIRPAPGAPEQQTTLESVAQTGNTEGEDSASPEAGDGSGDPDAESSAQTSTETDTSAESDEDTGAEAGAATGEEGSTDEQN